ncbi:MAG: endonuclease/exonuclease/phosphatase family protein [Acidimicrobiales bacterium]
MAGAAGSKPDRHLALATFNLHGGVDGWGRPFDVIAECAALDADVLVLQESWTPDATGRSTAATVADRLGYDLSEVELAAGRFYAPDPAANHRWGPRSRQAYMPFRLDDPGRGRRSLDRIHPQFSTGRWGLAILTRAAVEVEGRTVIALGHLKRDMASRVAISCTISVGDRRMTIIGTHMSHLLQGSPKQLRRLRAALPDPRTSHAVLAGDMNLWGPPLIAMLPGWRRAYRGFTWPSYRPISQPDHVLVTRPVSVIGARAAGHSGSDHLPVRVTLEVS